MLSTYYFYYFNRSGNDDKTEEVNRGKLQNMQQTKINRYKLQRKWSHVIVQNLLHEISPNVINLSVSG